MNIFAIKIRVIIIIIILNFAHLESIGQLLFNQLTVNDGLSQYDASCIIQDNYGFIWVGTYDGLNRFDGYNVENYSSLTENTESISSNRITCLFEDSQKRLWIGTDGEGINYFDLKKEKFIRIETPQGYRVIHDFIEDKNGDVLVATSNGVLKIKKTPTLSSPELLQLPLTGLIINKMAVCSYGIFFATNNGLWQMKNDVCTQIDKTKLRFISTLTADNADNIWFGTQGYLGCVSYQNESISINRIELEIETEIVSLCSSSDNRIWIGTLNRGLFVADAIKRKIIGHITNDLNHSRNLLTNSILSLYCDNSNMLWVANRKGVCYASLFPVNFKQIPLNQELSSSQHIPTLLYDQRYIYFGTQNEGCYLFNTDNHELKKIRLPQNLFPNHFYKFDNMIYLASNLGMFYSTKEELNFRHIELNTEHDENEPHNIFSMCRDPFGNSYYGTYNGLIIQSKNKCDWAHYLYDQTEMLRNKRIFTLLYDNLSNCIWVGTISEGIYKINLTEQGKFQSLELYNRSLANNYHITSNTIWCFYIDKNDNIWVGTDAGLLLKQKGSYVFSQISAQGVIDKKIMAIIEDNQGQLWLSNSQGIISYTPETQQVKKYSYNDGLSTSSFTEGVDKDEEGNIYFGSINGINSFNPSWVMPGNQINNVFFTGLNVHQNNIIPQASYLGSVILKKSINETDLMQLNYRQNNFSFEFAGSNFINADENEFRYKLLGYDKEWILTKGKHHFASYSNLEPEDYTFVVEAANNNGIWSNKPKTIRVKITPAPWKTNLAYFIYFTLVITLIVVFLYFFFNRQRLKQKIYLDQLNHEKEQKIHELKLTFFTDVAHEFKTPLSLIIGPLNDLMHNDLIKDRKEFCFQVISRNTKRMMFLVNQLLDFRMISANINILHATKNNLSEFMHHVTKAFLWQAQNENIHFNIRGPKEFICYFDSNIMEKVLYNIISNAFKYTPKKGIIEVEVKPVWKNQVQIANIIVRDSGKGIPDEAKNKIFERYFHGKERYSSGIGLHLSYALIKAHNGEIAVSDSNYGGAEFVLSIPVSKNAFEDNELNGGEKVTQWPQDYFKIQHKQVKSIAPERERILIVEDDHDLRAYLRNCLQSQYHVSEASNGIEGINIAKKEIPDIIITDVMMPEMDGIEMCKKIKDAIEVSHIPILMLTAKSDDEYQKEGLESGAWDYITKPFNTEALLKKVDNIIETRNRFKSFLATEKITIEVKKHYKPFDQKLISKITETVQQHLDDSEYTVEDLAQNIGLSRMQLHRKLKALVGQTTTGFINSIRIYHARLLFDQGCDRIQEAMAAVGINSYSHFNNSFKKIIGLSPSEYIEKQKQPQTNER